MNFKNKIKSVFNTNLYDLGVIHCITIKGDENIKFDLISFVKVRNSYEIQEKKYDLGLDDIKSIKESDPIILTLNNKNVISKSFDKEPSKRGKNELYEVVRSNELSWINVITRKEYLVTLIPNIHEFKNIVRIYVGLENIIHLSSNKNDFNISGYEVKIDSEHITINRESKPSDNVYKIDGDEYSSLDLLNYLGLVDYISENHFYSPIENFDLLKNESELKERKKFRVNIATTVFLTFIILLVNVFIKDYYISTREDLNAQLQQKEIQNSLDDKLRNEFHAKLNLIKKAGFINASSPSFQLDKIGGSIRGEVQLKNLELYPAVKEQETIRYVNNQLIAVGITNESSSLELWIKKLKKLDFVKQVEIQSFSSINNSVKKFKLKIELN